MHDYWNNRKMKLEDDLEHIKRNMKNAREFEEKEHLQEVYAMVYDELEIAKKAVAQFGY